LAPWCLRLPAVLFGLAALGIIYRAIKQRNGEPTAAVITLMGAIGGVYFEIMHRASTDSAAIFCCFAGLALYAATCLSRKTQHRRHQDILLAVLLAVSFYAKNFYTFLIVMPPVLLHMLLYREFMRAFRFLLLTAFATLLALLPWCLAIYRSGGWEYLRIVFFDNTLGRFLPLNELVHLRLDPLNDAYYAEKNYTPWYYIAPLLTLSLPWLLIFIASIPHAFRYSHRDRYGRFLQTALIVIPLVLTLSSSKVTDYLIPYYFIMLLVMGEFLHRLFRQSTLPAWQQWLTRLNLLLISLLILLAPPALAWALRTPVYLLWLLPALPLTVWAVRELLTHLDRADSIRIVLYGITAGFLVIGSTIFPAADEQKSCTAFFQKIQPKLDKYNLYCHLYNDRNLPLLNYGLNRRFTIITDRKEAAQVLASPEPVALLVYCKDYHRHREFYSTVPHQLITANTGKNHLGLLVNRPPVRHRMADTQAGRDPYTLGYQP
jgi:hypothetical protein